MKMSDKLKIVNAGGEVDETNEIGSWTGIKIRKGKKAGEVIQDTNGMFRYLKVKFNDGSKDTIVLNNIGEDPKSCHRFEYYSRNHWHRF